jgi:hypothetical protein
LCVCAIARTANQEEKPLAKLFPQDGPIDWKKYELEMKNILAFAAFSAADLQLDDTAASVLLVR